MGTFSKKEFDALRSYVHWAVLEARDGGHGPSLLEAERELERLLVHGDHHRPTRSSYKETLKDTSKEDAAPSELMDDLTPSEIAILEGCLRDATPGPWAARTFMVMGGANLQDRVVHYGTSTGLPPRRSPETVANALLAELGRNWMPRLLAEVRRRRQSPPR